MRTLGPAWVPVAAVLVAAGAATAAVLDALLDPVPGATSRARVARPVWETARLLRQRRHTTDHPDMLLWRAGVAGPLAAALLMAVVVPVGGTVLADLDVGVVWFNAIDVTLWAVWWLAGWGPNSVWGLVGGYRFLAQALSYELPLMFALIAPATAASSLRLSEIVAAQHDLWFIVQMPVAFAVFCAAVVAFSVWGPFSAPAGVDIAGGVTAEAAAVDRLLLTAGRYALLAVGAAMAVALFLGGGSGPALPAWCWTVVKTLLVLAALVAVRRRVPAMRAEPLATLGWLVVLPATLLQVLIVAGIAATGT